MEKDKLKNILNSLQLYDELKKNKRTLRKVNNEDLFGTNNTKHNKGPIQGKNKIKSFRMQEEYGEKKFIKP